MRAALLATFSLTALGAMAGIAPAQPAREPRVTVGAAVAASCPGTNDGIPTLDLACGLDAEGAPGPYLRPYASFRPTDRLLVTSTLGYVRFPRLERTVYDDGIRPAIGIVVPSRTAWHVHATAAYVGGARAHPVRGYVGGGLVFFRDPVQSAFVPAEPSPSYNLIPPRRSGIDGVFVTGVLVRLPGRLEGRLTYTLAEQVAAALVADGGWRHEVGVAVGWGVR